MARFCGLRSSEAVVLWAEAGMLVATAEHTGTDGKTRRRFSPADVIRQTGVLRRPHALLPRGA